MYEQNGVNPNLTDSTLLEDHFHNYDTVFGLAAAPNGTVHGGDVERLTPYVVTSGNNAFGTALVLLGTSDTPYRAGSTHFDPRKISIIDVSSANPYIFRMIWGTPSQTAAQAVTAKQYSDVVVHQPTANGQNKPQELTVPRVAAGNILWAEVKSATNLATVSILLIIHEYTI